MKARGRPPCILKSDPEAIQRLSTAWASGGLEAAAAEFPDLSRWTISE